MTAPETRTGLGLFVACLSSNPSTLKVYSLRWSDALMKAELMSCRAALLSAEHTHRAHPARVAAKSRLDAGYGSQVYPWGQVLHCGCS